MQIRYRRGTPTDIIRNPQLLESERALFPPSVWRILPDLLADLLNRERILLCVLDDIDSGRAVLMGASAFLLPEFLDQALARGEGLLGAAFLEESRGCAAFLNPKQVRDANRREDLRLLIFFGVPQHGLRPDATLGNMMGDPGSLMVLDSVMEAWSFFHKGFQFRELWSDRATPLLFHLYLQLGFNIHQERKLGDGTTAKVMRLTRDRAVEMWPAGASPAMISPPPRLGFTRAEQKLLELALLDRSDRDAAAELQLSAEAIKKRWRSIYAKISRMEPSLLRSDLTGADQRRALLQSLRNNLQEIRPF
jgi:hypothetical protein